MQAGPHHLTDSTPTEYRFSRYDVERIVMVAATGRTIAAFPFGAERGLDRDASAVIEVRNLHKWFGSLHVLRDVSNVFAANKVVVVCGPSGSGKSTLLRCINGLETPSEGDVTVDGLPVHGRGARINDVRRRVGMVFQQFNLFPHLDVVGNITLALRKVK